MPTLIRLLLVDLGLHCLLSLVFPNTVNMYRISSLIRQCFFFLPKQSQKSRSVLKDGSRSLGLFRKGKTRITAKLHRADLIICTHSREGKPRLIAK